MEVVVVPGWMWVSQRFPFCVVVLWGAAVAFATSGARRSTDLRGCTVSGPGQRAGVGDLAVELLSPGFFSATLRCAPPSSWSLGVLFCRWSCARSSPPLFAGEELSIWWFFGLELLPVQGSRYDGGGSGAGGRSSAAGAGSRLRASWPRFVQRFRSRRLTAGGSCSSKASRCSPFLVRGWPALSSSPGDAGVWEWRRVAMMISFFAVVWVVQFRLFWPVCAFVLCVVLLL